MRTIRVDIYWSRNCEDQVIVDVDTSSIERIIRCLQLGKVSREYWLHTFKIRSQWQYYTVQGPWPIPTLDTPRSL